MDHELIGIASILNPILVIQGPSSTVRATFRGVSSLLRHASAGTLSSVSGVTNALSRNLGSQVVRPIAGTMGLVSDRRTELFRCCWPAFVREREPSPTRGDIALNSAEFVVSTRRCWGCCCFLRTDASFG